MNSGTGFHQKAVKGEPAGGHFNSSVNSVRSHHCRLSKQYIADALKRWRRLLSGKAREFSQNAFDGANGLWTSSTR